MKLSSKDLYRLVSERSNPDTDTPELSKAFYEFCGNFITPAYENDEKRYNEAYEAFLAITKGFNEQGFVSGFDTAVSLVLNPKGQDMNSI